MVYDEPNWRLLLNGDSNICEDGTYTIYAQNCLNCNLTWNTGITSNQLTVNQVGKYWVTNVDSLCFISDTVTVDFKCDCNVYFPNVFTPNDDLKNETFYAVYNNECIFEDFKLDIYNRWGEKIREFTNPADAWDGTVGLNLKVSQGLYYWICTYELKYPDKDNKTKIILHGPVTVLY